MAEDRDIPCPGCGFKVLTGYYGSYHICPFCNWEDCAFQLANPLDVGGPNGRSLVDHQADGLKRWPLDVRQAEAYGRRWVRDDTWRALTAKEIAAYEGANDWYPAVESPEQCYWNRSPGATGSSSNPCDGANRGAHGFEDEPVAPGAVKDEAKRLIDLLPDSVTWDDIVYSLGVRMKIEEGLKDAREGRTITHENVKKLFSE